MAERKWVSRNIAILAWGDELGGDSSIGVGFEISQFHVVKLRRARADHVDKPVLSPSTALRTGLSA
jgi:hypothetical protein